MKPEKILAAMVFALFLTAGNCLANDPAQLSNEMHANPYNFIRYGAQGMDSVFYIDKSSLAVVKYEPPRYEIIIRNIVVGSATDEFLSYSYDYKSRRMYVKLADRHSGAKSWIYIDPKNIKGRSIYQQNWESYLAAGEIVFYMAYNMNFFDKPVTDAFKNYLNGQIDYYK